MARLFSILAIGALAVFAVAGCGDDGDDSGATTEAAATGSGSDGDAMKADGDAMKEEASTGTAASGDALVANRRKRGRRGKFVKAVGSEFGRVVADGKGEAFYLFDKEKSKRSRCYGACARAWPPVITKGRPRAGKGVNQRLLGVTRRKNGRFQVTYRNHPLYYYVDDRPGLILCQNVAEFGGLWLVVKPNGKPVT